MPPVARRALWRPRSASCACAGRTAPFTSTKNTGTKKIASKRPREHSADHRTPDRVAPARPGAAGDRQRQDAEHERQTGHQDRSQPQLRRLQRRLATTSHPPGHAFLGEFDDQDRILRRKADSGDESDLEINIVVEARSASPRRRRRSRPAARPASTASGTDQLSYSAARHRNTISSDKPVERQAPARSSPVCS